MKLDKLAMGLSIGIMWGLMVFAATLWVVIAKGEGAHLILLNRFYLGYTITVAGGFIGFLWGFVDGFIAGWIIAFFYNLFSRSKKA